MNRFHNVRLIDTKISAYDLIEKSRCVASVIGSTSLEAIFRGKVGIIFGHAWFMHADGICKVKDLESCREAFKKVEEGYIPDKEKLINYLYAISKLTIRGYQNVRTKKGRGVNLSDKENGENIAREFYKKFKEATKNQ